MSHPDKSATLCVLATALAAHMWGVPTAALATAGRGPNRVAQARQGAMYLAHVGLGVCQAKVATWFGRDRATLRHALARMEDARDGAAFDLAMEQMIAAASLWADTFLATNLRGDQ